jgi:hypothetical protein
MAITSLDKLYNAKKKINELVIEVNASGATNEPLRTIARSVHAEEAAVAFLVIGDTLTSVSYLYNATTSIGYASLVPLTGQLTSVVAPVDGVSLITVGGVNYYIYSLDVVDRYLASVNYAVTQLAGGVKAKVGIVTLGITVDNYDYLIYPNSGLVFSRGAVTGTTTDAFNPSTGAATGLTGSLLVVTSVKQVKDGLKYAEFEYSLTYDLLSASTTAGFNVIPLNAEVINSISDDVSINFSTKKITLTAGVYYIETTANAFKPERAFIRILDESDSTSLLESNVAYSPTTSSVGLHVKHSGYVTLTQTTTIGLYLFSQVAISSSGFGINSGVAGYDSKFSTIRIYKVG